MWCLMLRYVLFTLSAIRHMSMLTLCFNLIIFFLNLRTLRRITLLHQSNCPSMHTKINLSSLPCCLAMLKGVYVHPRPPLASYAPCLCMQFIKCVLIMLPTPMLPGPLNCSMFAVDFTFIYLSIPHSNVLGVCRFC